MIRIEKSFDDLPSVLLDRGVAETGDMLDSWDAFIADPELPVPDFKIKGEIYGHKEVKLRLLKEQHGKCAFCEGRMWAIVDGDPEPIMQHSDVEHYRPKGRARQAEDIADDHPGYFWLAYDWSNLYMACSICNQVYKRDWFPLEDPLGRAQPRGDIALEKPLIVSPAEDPAEHLEFNENVIKPKTERGRATIQRTGLDRKGLNDDRRILLDELKVFVGVLRTLKATVDAIEDSITREKIGQNIGEMTKLISERAEPTSRYSLCVKTYLADAMP